MLVTGNLILDGCRSLKEVPEGTSVHGTLSVQGIPAHIPDVLLKTAGGYRGAAGYLPQRRVLKEAA